MADRLSFAMDIVELFRGVRYIHTYIYIRIVYTMDASLFLVCGVVVLVSRCVECIMNGVEDSGWFRFE